MRKTLANTHRLDNGNFGKIQLFSSFLIANCCCCTTFCCSVSYLILLGRCKRQIRSLTTAFPAHPSTQSLLMIQLKTAFLNKDRLRSGESGCCLTGRISRLHLVYMYIHFIVVNINFMHACMYIVLYIINYMYLLTMFFILSVFNIGLLSEFVDR